MWFADEAASHSHVPRDAATDCAYTVQEETVRSRCASHVHNTEVASTGDTWHAGGGCRCVEATDYAN